MSSINRVPKPPSAANATSLRKPVKSTRPGRLADVLDYDGLPASRSSSTSPAWFEGMSRHAREKYAKEFGARTFYLHDNTCLVISYPRRDMTVAVTDLDAGSVFWLHIGIVKPLLKASMKAGSRHTEVADAHFSWVLASDICDEARDIIEFATTVAD